MRHLFCGFIIILTSLPAISFCQDGSDIASAIPIYFNQTINDTIDKTTRPWQVYSIALAKGQVFTATATSGAAAWNLRLYGPAAHTVLPVNTGFLQDSYGLPGQTITYTAATEGVYYVALYAQAISINYKLQLTAATILPVASPPPPVACVTGLVDYITYSTRLVAAGLPDEASVGGAKLCITGCVASPPAYPLLVKKMEEALESGTPVSACYDATGTISQLKLMRP